MTKIKGISIRTRIYQFGKKIAYSFPVIPFLYRKAVAVCQLCKKVAYSFIAIIPVIGILFRKRIIKDLVNHKDIRFLLNSLFSNIDEGKKFLTSLPTNNLLNHRDLFRKLVELQKEKIKEALDSNKKTVAIYFPDCAYREHVGDIANKLRNKNYNVLTFIGTICDDKYEKQENVFYARGNIINDMDFIDVLICVTPSSSYNLPMNATKIWFVHDIHDSALGDMDKFLRLLLLYDYVFLPSDYVVNRFKKIISKAKEKNKKVCLIKGGYIKLDRNLEYFKDDNQKALIYAPTVTGLNFEDLVSLPLYGDKIIGAILNNFTDYDLIFRPHPHTLHTPEVQNIAKKYANHHRFIFDDNGSFYMDNYSKSALMITDMSGTAYTYAFTTLRPVIFFSRDEKEVMRRFDTYQYFNDRNKIGYVAENIDELIEKIKLLLTSKDEFSLRIKAYRDSLIYNIGKSEDYFVDKFEYIIEDKKHPGWVYI